MQNAGKSRRFLMVVIPVKERHSRESGNPEQMAPNLALSTVISKRIWHLKLPPKLDLADPFILSDVRELSAGPLGLNVLVERYFEQVGKGDNAGGVVCYVFASHLYMTKAST